MDALDKAYRALPAGDLKEKPLHKLDASILKRRQFMDNKLTLNKFRLDQLENLGSQQTQVVQQSLAANLHDIPLYITSTEAMVQLLKTSLAVAREHDTQGLRSQELTCTHWTAAAQSAIKTLQTEIDVMRGNLAIAQKDSGHSR